MFYTKISYIITFCLLFFGQFINGQNKSLIFDHITLKHGLSHDRVFDIAEDSTGYIWIGTVNGLSRYDGVNFKTFKNELADSTSISENFVECLFVDNSNNLWIGTNNSGLNKYNPETESFSRYIPKINDINSSANETIHTIDQLKNGKLIIGTNDGLSIYSKNNNSFKNFKNTPNNPNSLISNNVRCIYVDNDSITWIGTAEGLCQMNTNKNNFNYFLNHTSNNNSLSNDYIISLTKTCDSILWIGTTNGLNSYNTNSKQFTRYFHNPNNKNSIANNYIHSLEIDSDSNLWVGTSKGITKIYHPNSSQKIFEHYSYNKAYPKSLHGNKISSLFYDSNNIMWVSTLNNGISKCHLHKNYFKNENHDPKNPNSLSYNIVRSIYEDKKENLWAGTDGGGLNFKANNQENYIRLFDLNNGKHAFGSDLILDIYESSTGDIWVGTWGDGVSKFSAKDVSLIKQGILPSIQSFTHNPLDSTSISGNIVQEITEDSFGNIWIGTENGLNIYNTKNHCFKRIKHINDDSHSLCDDRVQSGCIIEDHNLNLWIGTWNGLAKINLQNFPYRNGVLKDSTLKYTIKFDNYYLNSSDNVNNSSNSRITTLCLDSIGNIWIGTFGNGLNMLNLSNNKPIITKYTVYDGLPDEVIYGIEMGNNNDLWLSTNNGLSHFIPSTEQFNNFNKNDNIQGSEFYWGAHVKRKNGEIIFGGTNGLTSFFPDSITQHKTYSPTIITNMSIFNIPIDFNAPNSPTNKSLEYTNKVELSYKQNVISFYYTTINYHYPDLINFAYILEGFEKNWNFVDSRRTAIYTNLEPGKYTFKVAQVSDQNTIEENSIDSINIVIKSPFYKTQFFQIGIFILVFSLIYLVYKLKVRSIEKHKIILQEKVSERTSELTYANKLLLERNEEITVQRENLVKQRDKIRAQNKELKDHRLGLEKQVEIRTKELLIAKEKAEESDRLKSAFLANMSHEIRTPLNALIGFSNLLTDNSIEDLEKKNFIRQINKNSDDLLMLIDDIIDLSFIESAQLKIHKEEFELKSFIRGIIENYKSVPVNSQLKFIVSNSITSNSIYINSDPYRLRQIITNLINNAFKFTEKGIIEFGFKMESNKGVFYVKDTGIGISKENQNLIFDRFRKIESKNISKLYRGNGLGLTISKRLAELLDANLFVESEIRKGSTFYLILPGETINLN